MPNLYIIARPNGAGKTTASYTILPEMLHCKEFVNADEIAKGLSPFQPEKVAFEAGRIMLNRIKELIAEKKTFAFETTLSTRSYTSLVDVAKKTGYKVHLVFFYLDSHDLAIKRVELRVKRGGHNIPENVIKRRYKRGLINLVNLFIHKCDKWMVFDNSEKATLIAKGSFSSVKSVNNSELWNLIRRYEGKQS